MDGQVQLLPMMTEREEQVQETTLHVGVLDLSAVLLRGILPAWHYESKVQWTLSGRSVCMFRSREEWTAHHKALSTPQ